MAQDNQDKTDSQSNSQPSEYNPFSLELPPQHATSGYHTYRDTARRPRVQILKNVALVSGANTVTYNVNGIKPDIIIPVCISTPTITMGVLNASTTSATINSSGSGTANIIIVVWPQQL